MSSVENQMNAVKVATPYVAGIGAAAGAVGYGGSELYRQVKILKNPDEFIKTVEGEVARKKGFNTPFFKGTQEAADLANKKLDAYLEKAKAFAKGGKLDYMSLLKETGKGAGICAAVGVGILGLSLIINQAIKGISMTVAEGVNEANAKKA